ncbi:response regulator transcription factor [Geodermatophilus sabuli]|uniref:Response regulator transcription factor n=1 Tax=Geodermatophilus sabuli TaxID=1564158 RepID=A0A7K3W4Z8_9ACTN|nr:response regulator transcription factor [Geodermatophilus sabuli]NEK59443.1 response regulator transcription factor [Geodermatophilus sabuli]
MIRVLVADDHQLIRQALTDLFADTTDIRVVGECADGGEVAGAVARTLPDVVLMDLRMPVMDGLEATRELLATHPQVRVVVLTGALTPATVREATALGVAGYLLKGDDPGALPDRIRTVASGGRAWSAAAAALVENGWESMTLAPAVEARSTYAAESPPRLR